MINIMKPTKEMKYDNLYMDLAVRIAQMSHDIDTKVGSLIVKDNNILAFGFNGMPSGMPNDCKDKDGVTKFEVIHAETNAICKLAKTSSSAEGATMYCTLAPCGECAKLIIQSGIARIVFDTDYKNDSGILLLMKQKQIKIDRVKRKDK